MRLLLILPACLAFVACAPSPQPVEPARPDPTAEAWYPQIVDELRALNQDAAALFQQAAFDRAAELVAKGQPLETRLLSVPRPTLPAMEASSDLDDLYGRLLLRNRHFDWASSIFQKNVIRWKAWKPATDDTARRLATARAAVAECERQGKK